MPPWILVTQDVASGKDTWEARENVEMREIRPVMENTNHVGVTVCTIDRRWNQMKSRSMCRGGGKVVKHTGHSTLGEASPGRLENLSLYYLA